MREARLILEGMLSDIGVLAWHILKLVAVVVLFTWWTWPIWVSIASAPLSASSWGTGWLWWLFLTVPVEFLLVDFTANYIDITENRNGLISRKGPRGLK